tara:strand:+ start:2602 stop:3405 length:804 start_codon:yes stop_codon:yes gene_type:complete
MPITITGSDAAATRTSLGLGDASTKTVGVSNGNVIAADSTGIPAINGSQITALNATNLGSGTVPTARMGSGTASGSTVLHGNGTWAAVAAGGTHELIASASASSSSILEVTGLDTSFDSWRLIATELTVSVTDSDTSIVVQYGTSAGYINDSQYDGTESIWEAGTLSDSASSGQGFMVSNANIRGGVDNGFFTFDYLLQRSINKWGPNLVGNFVCRKSNNTTMGGVLMQSHRNVNDNAGNTMTKIKCFPTQGNFTTGRFSVYGVKHS